MSCRYKNECPSYSGWCEGIKQDFEKCIPFLVTAYENAKARLNKRLLKNKIWGSIIILVGVASVFIEQDATFLILSLVFGLPLLFARENWIM